MAYILLATSRDATRRHFEAALASDGHTFSHCGDGEAVNAVLRDTWPDLVIADVDLPGMDAFALVERLQAESQARPVPPLILRPNPHKPGAGELVWVDGSAQDIRSLVTARLNAADARHAVGRILVVDDDASLRTSLQKWLENEGHEVVLAIDGEDALSQMTPLPDLVLTDVDMPRMDGFSLIQRIRTMAECNDLPIIVMTARAVGATEASRGLELGANDYVRKPFDWRELGARVQAQMRVKALARMSAEKQRDLAVIELAGAAAHEINNPLSVLMARIELLADRADVDPKIRAELTELDHVIDRIAEVVRKLGQVRSYQVQNYCAGVNIVDLDAAGSGRT